MSGGRPPYVGYDQLQLEANRCLLIVLGSSPLDEDDCLDMLSLYGSIKFIQLTSDRRAAFVDFECEHAPLLVARCYAYYKTNPEVPMPNGIATLLPGCSLGNYLYLLVPRELPSPAIQRYFQEWGGQEVTVHRTGTLSPSYRVVVHLKSAADRFTQQHVFECLVPATINVNGQQHTFYAVPTIPQLADSSRICDSEGCEECNVVALRPYIGMEDAKKARESPAAPCATPMTCSTAAVPPRPLMQVRVPLPTLCIDPREPASPPPFVPRRFRCTTIPKEERWDDDVPSPPPPTAKARKAIVEREDLDVNVFLSPDLPRFQGDGEAWEDVPRPPKPNKKKNKGKRKVEEDREPSPRPSPSWSSGLPNGPSMPDEERNGDEEVTEERDPPPLEPSSPSSSRLPNGPSMPDEEKKGEEEIPEERAPPPPASPSWSNFFSFIPSIFRPAKAWYSPAAAAPSGEDRGEGEGEEASCSVQRQSKKEESPREMREIEETGEESSEGEISTLQRAVNAPGSEETGQESDETMVLRVMPQRLDVVQGRREERGTEFLSASTPIFRWSRPSVVDQAEEEEDYRSIEELLFAGNKGEIRRPVNDVTEMEEEKGEESKQRDPASCLMTSSDGDRSNGERSMEQPDVVASVVSPLHLSRRTSGVDSDGEERLEKQEEGGKEEEEETPEGEQRDTLPAVCPTLTDTSEKAEDVIVEASESSVEKIEEDVVVEEEEATVNRSGETEQEPTSHKTSDVIVEESECPIEAKGEDVVEPSSHKIFIDASDVIVGESESSGEEELVVEETQESEEKEEEEEEELVVEDTQESEEGEGDSERTSSAIDNTQTTIDYESDDVRSIISQSKQEEADERDSDDLLSGEEEDQWKSVGSHSMSRVSGVSTADWLVDKEEEEKDYGVTVDDLVYQPVLTMEEEAAVRDIVRSMLDRAVEMVNGPAPSPVPSVPLKHDDTESSRFSDGSLEDTADYDTACDDSPTMSDASSDTVVGETLDAYDDWDEADKLKYGVGRNLMLTTIEEDGEEEEDVSSAATPIPHWSRKSTVDQVDVDEEEEYRSESEYHDWLTREVPSTRPDSQSRPGSALSMAPLPSSLPTTTWGTGIVPEVRNTVIP